MVQCSFAGGRRCLVRPDESGLCPRHAFMIAQMGAEKAEVEEYGIECKCCGDMCPADEPSTCPVCEMEGVCIYCQTHGSCCIDSYLDEEDWDDGEEWEEA